MTEHDPVRRRWAEDTPADPAARLLARVPRQSLSVSQLARVRIRLDASLQKTAPRRWLLPTAGALSVGLLIGFLGRAGLDSNKLAPVQSNGERACGPAAPVRMALLGTGDATVGSDEVPTRLRSGSLLIRTAEEKALIEAPGARLAVSAHSTVELCSSYGEGPLVAAYLGSVAVSWSGGERELDVILQAGQAATSAGPVTLPVGRAQQVERYGLHDPAVSIAPMPLDVALAAERAAAPPRVQEPPLPAGIPSKQLPGRRTSLPEAPPLISPPAGPEEKEQKEEKKSEDTLLEESQLLGGAMERLRTTRDATGALAALDSYHGRFPRGQLRREAELLRINALLALGRNQDALLALDLQPLTEDTPRALERRITRGELRAAASRCADAITDFDAVLGQVQGELAERALYGRSRCFLQRGETGRARNDLAEYLRRFPNGRFSSVARQLFLSPP